MKILRLKNINLLPKNLVAGDLKTLSNNLHQFGHLKIVDNKYK